MRSNHLLVAGVVALAASGCILRAGGGESDLADASALADGGPAGDGQAALGPFSEPTLLAISAPAAADDDPSMTGDLRELYFDSDRSGSAGQGDLFLAVPAASGAFEAAAPVAELASPNDDTGFRVSDDGLMLVFSSNRPGGLGLRDIWISVRLVRADPWGMPQPLTAINSAVSEAGPSLDDDGRRIVFSADRDAGNSDLYIATRASVDDPFGPPEPIEEINTASVEGSPSLRDGGRTLYFYSNRDGTDDVYVATRRSVDESFGEPQPIAELNSPSSDLDLWVSEDGRSALLSSDRNGNSELYEASR